MLPGGPLNVAHVPLNPLIVAVPFDPITISLPQVLEMVLVHVVILFGANQSSFVRLVE